LENVIKLACILIVLSALATTIAVAVAPLFIHSHVHRHGEKLSISLFLELNPALRALGYPRILYFNSSIGLESYSPREPPFVYVYAVNGARVEGYAYTKVVSLEQALAMVSNIVGVSPKSYRLLYAELYPGIVVNRTIVRDPMWVLELYRVCRGVPLYSAPDFRTGYVVYVDALKGIVLRVSIPTIYIKCPSIPRILNLHTALQIASSRHRWIETVIERAKLVEAKLFIVKLSSLRSEFTIVNHSLFTKYWPVWLVFAYLKHERVELAIDAVSGRLIAYSRSPLYPPTPWPRLRISIEPINGCRVEAYSWSTVIDGVRMRIVVPSTLLLYREVARLLIVAHGVDVPRITSLSCKVYTNSSKVSITVEKARRGVEASIKVNHLGEVKTVLEIVCWASTPYGYRVYGSKNVLIVMHPRLGLS